MCIYPSTDAYLHVVCAIEPPSTSLRTVTASYASRISRDMSKRRAGGSPALETADQDRRAELANAWVAAAEAHADAPMAGTAAHDAGHRSADSD